MIGSAVVLALAYPSSVVMTTLEVVVSGELVSLTFDSCPSTHMSPNRPTEKTANNVFVSILLLCSDILKVASS